jgi:hypothetical protein
VKLERQISQASRLTPLFWSARVFLLLLLVPPSATATTLARLTLDQMASGSPAVARVRCVRSESLWKNGSIWTVATLQVVESVKGILPAEISVELPGGRVGHFTTTVDGSPKFTRGEEAILFLAPAGPAGFTVSGWAEGTFRIGHDLRTGAETVTQDSSALAVFDTATRTFRTGGIRRMPIGEFRARLAAAVARGKEKSR